jgi:hypothetical protein
VCGCYADAVVAGRGNTDVPVDHSAYSFFHNYFLTRPVECRAVYILLRDGVQGAGDSDSHIMPMSVLFATQAASM